jgi:hypothetical protein
MRKSAKRPLSVKRNISVVHRDRERPLKIGQFTFTVCASRCILKERRVRGANQEKGGQTMTDGGSSLHGDQSESAEPPSSSSGLN